MVNYGENTEILFSSCALLIRKTILLLGGFNEQYQISEVYPWKNTMTKRIDAVFL